MITTNTTNISPVDALWALYQSQTKANRKKFRDLIKKEEVNEQNAANAKSSIAVGAKRREDFNGSDYITLKSHEDIDRYFESM